MLERLFNFLQDIFKKQFKAQEFGLYIKELRKSKKLSLRRVSKLGFELGVDFSYGYVHRLEKGLIKRPDIDLVSGVLRSLGVADSDIVLILKKYDLL